MSSWFRKWTPFLNLMTSLKDIGLWLAKNWSHVIALIYIPFEPHWCTDWEYTCFKIWQWRHRPIPASDWPKISIVLMRCHIYRSNRVHLQIKNIMFLKFTDDVMTWYRPLIGRKFISPLCAVIDTIRTAFIYRSVIYSL